MDIKHANQPLRYRMDIVLPMALNEPVMNTFKLLPYGDKYLIGSQDRLTFYEDTENEKIGNRGVFATVPVYSCDTAEIAALFFVHWFQIQPGMRSEKFLYINNALDEKRLSFLESGPECEAINMQNEKSSEYGMKLTPAIYDNWCRNHREKVCLFEEDENCYHVMVVANFRPEKYPLAIHIALHSF